MIDGHPKHGNLAGYANYASDRVANADFEDRGRATVRSAGAPRTNVVLQAKVRIEAGSEIRVDYDMGVVGRPFRAQMLRRGVAGRELDGSGYAQVRWRCPGGSGAAEEGGRARARVAAEGGDGGASAQTDMGRRAEERKRGASAAQVPPPRGEEGRKRVLRSGSQLGDG